MRKWGLCFLLVFGIQFILKATGFVSSNHIGTDHGLSQSSVNAILQDPSGFIWIATDDGLNRYDGHSFKIINIPEWDTLGYQSNYINTILLDKNEDLWIGTRAGVYCYNSKKQSLKPYRIHPTSENPVGDQVWVRDIIQRKNGEIVVLTRNAVYALQDDEQLQPLQLDPTCLSLPRFRLYTAFEDQQGRLWLGSSNGLMLFGQAQNRFVFHQSDRIKNLPVIDITSTPGGDLLFASFYQVVRLSAKNNEFVGVNINSQLADFRLTYLYASQEGTVWIGTRNHGVLQCDQDLNQIKSRYNAENNLISSDYVTSIFQDITGLYWIGTNDNGVSVLNLGEQMVHKIETNRALPSGVNCMLPVPGKKECMWVGSSEHGVALINYSDKSSIEIKTQATWLSNLSVASMAYKEPFLYLGTQENGLFVVKTHGEQWTSHKQYNLLTDTLKRELGTLSELVFGPDNKLYLLSERQGLFSFDPVTETIQAVSIKFETQSTTDFSIQQSQVSSLIADPAGFIWIGTFGNGLFKLDFENGQCLGAKKVEQSLFSKMFITCMFRSENALWVGTQGSGLIELDPVTLQYKKYDERNGLSNKVIHAIVTDKAGDIWISTNRGLSKLTGQAQQFINYSGSSYLQGYEFNDNAVLADEDGTLFFAGKGGINFLKPDTHLQRQQIPLVLISELLINNQLILPDLIYNDRVILDRSIEYIDQLNLEPEDKVVSFAISPIHYSDAKNNIFYYQLEPFDKTWVKRDMTNRYVTYNNLKGGSYRFKIKAVSSDGVISEEKSILIRVNPPLWEKTWFNILIYSLAGLMIGLLFIFWYHNQKHREFLLEHEKNTLQSLIDNIPDTIYFKDLQSRFTRVNLAQARLMGLADKDMALGKTDFEFFDHAEEAFRIEQEIIRTGVPIINHFHKLVVDGKVKYLSDTKIALYDKDKKCIGTVGVSRDLTELKLAEEAMLESQAKFKALFENAPLAIFRIDKNQKVIEYNHRFKNMFGYANNEELENLKTSDLLVDPELGNLIFETVIETKEVNAEINLKRTDESTFIANLTLALLEEGFKEITIEGIIEDITQMAIARDEIIKAKDKAVEADRLKSLFLANMSHEIRTPMNAIIGFTNMLREESLSTDDRNYFIDVIQNNGNNLVSLIDSIVDFSKLEAEQMSVSMSEFNINPLIDSIIDHAEKSIISEGKDRITIVKGKMETQPIRIVSDRHRLNQVFLHLISNAVKFTDQGEIEIGYQLENGLINFYIRDTGIGIDSSKFDYIFQRFNKIEDKNRLYGGTGLGLTISKGLIELMGGKIEVESEVDKGSTFFIRLPYEEQNNIS